MTPLPKPDSIAPADRLAAITLAAEARIAALQAGSGPDLTRRVDSAIALLDRAMPGRRYQDLPEELADLAAGDGAFPALLAARLLAGVAARRPARLVPDAVLPELSRQATRILAADKPNLDDDVFRKDLSICLLLSFPCVAQVVEQIGGIPRRALTSGGPGQALRLGAYLSRTGLRPGPYLEIHTHTPMLDGFNEAGWERCYELVAELLAARPHCPGMVGGSWFYDPALAKISPRLAYLADTPIGGGAFRVRLGPSEEDAELATATSSTRRALVEAGTYVPTKWLLIWPRKALLAWAAARRGEPR
nr:hypothetical protein [uncultured Rhodopila sp.]